MSSDLVTLVALVGLVVIAAALTSGLFQRMGIPQVALFLALGALVGSPGLELVAFELESPGLGAIAVLSLVLVLFTDAVSLRWSDLKTHLTITALVLGPGTILTAILTAVAAWALLGLSPAAAAILGAVLASTDPVMTRALLHLPNVPDATRYALAIESGLNDVVLLPIVLLATAVLSAGGQLPVNEIATVVGSVFLLGPVLGVLVAVVAVRALEWCRRRAGIRRDFESLYVLGVAFTAYAVAESFHASGFMAAFAAGLTVAVVDVELCDCFHEYGEATSQMLLLLGFVALGTATIWSGLTVIDAPTLGFALVALLGRTLVLQVLLPGRAAGPLARRLIVWFGPRGLSSLLLVLLPVFAGIPVATRLFSVTALVVLISVLVHGAGLSWATWRLRRRAEGAAQSSGLPGVELVPDPELITFDELSRLQEQRLPVTLLDVRRSRSDTRAAGAIPLPPAAPAESAASLALPRNEWLVAYCA